MDYICRKQLSLSGKEFLPGDVIPGENILSSRVRALKSSGHISDLSPESTAAKIEGNESVQFMDTLGVVFSKTEDGSPITTAVNSEQLQAVVDVMMKNAKDAATSLEEEVDETVLEMLKAVDSRKTVKEAAEKQLMIISSIKD